MSFVAEIRDGRLTMTPKFVRRFSETPELSMP
jgi:hypothetical protein